MKHLYLSLFGFYAGGLAFTVGNLGVKAGMNPTKVMVIFIAGGFLLVYACFVSVRKVVKMIKKEENE